MALIAASLLAADFTCMAEALRLVKAAGAPMVHLDVMDGHFVDDISVGQPVVRSVRKATDLVLDLHLLIERPERYIAEFAGAGGDRISVHGEATACLHPILQQLGELGIEAGVALNPATPVETLLDVLEDLDFVSVLSADPGLGEHPFIPRSMEKVEALASLRERYRLDFDIQVEGGIRREHTERIIAAGADILVAGSAIFSNGDPESHLREWVQVLSTSRRVSKA